MALSRESIALRKSNAVFKRGVDPDNLITVLYSNILLTPEEKSKATHKTLTDDQKLEEVFTSLERRVSVIPGDFHKLVEALRDEPALKPVGDKMQGIYDAEPQQKQPGDGGGVDYPDVPVQPQGDGGKVRDDSGKGKLELMCLTDWMTLQDDDDEEAAELWAADTLFLWNQKEINVHFTNKILAWRNEKGNFISPEEILSIANEWHQCGIDAGKDVVPMFINDDSKPSNIRIEFIEQGTSKSYVGTVAGGVDVMDPTMWLDLAPICGEGDCPSRYKRTIRHEFGHALGMKHEHSHPDAPLLYDQTKLEKHVKESLQKQRKDYSKKAVKEKIKKQWAKIIPKETDQPKKSEYDKFSVMHYLIPEDVQPSNYQGPQDLQLELSKMDKEWIVKHYSDVLTPADSGPKRGKTQPKGSEEQEDSTGAGVLRSEGSEEHKDERPDMGALLLIEFTNDKSQRAEFRTTLEIVLLWDNVATHLGIGNIIGNIRGNPMNVTNPEKAAQEMLKHWLQVDVDASWEKLITAMKKATLVNPAKDLEYAITHKINV